MYHWWGTFQTPNLFAFISRLVAGKINDILWVIGGIWNLSFFICWVILLFWYQIKSLRYDNYVPFLGFIFMVVRSTFYDAVLLSFDSPSAIWSVSWRPARPPPSLTFHNSLTLLVAVFLEAVSVYWKTVWLFSRAKNGSYLWRITVFVTFDIVSDIVVN